MSANRGVGDTGLIGLVSAALGVCCALPVLLSLGAGVTIAGLGVRSWLQAGVGLLVVGAGIRLRRNQTCHPAMPADRPERTADARCAQSG